MSEASFFVRKHLINGMPFANVFIITDAPNVHSIRMNKYLSIRNEN